MSSVNPIERVIESDEARAKRLIDAWLGEIARAVDTMRQYMDDINRETKFMVDDWDFQANAVFFELRRESREPVVYEFLVASTGNVAGEVAIGTRRRIPVAANTVLAISLKARVYDNDQIIITTGTLEAPGAAARLFLEMTGHMYPQRSV